MVLDLLRDVNVLAGLRELVESAYFFRQNMNTRVDSPILHDGTDLWKTWLDSRTMCLYGGVNEDDRHCFKVDHGFDLSSIIDASVNPDGSFSVDEEVYLQSQGREFIIIGKSDVKDAEADYAIRVDKYQSVKGQLSEINRKDLEKAGAFKIGVRLSPDEIAIHDGWLELAVGKNNATEQDYKESFQFLKDKYVPEAQKNNCFPDGVGMAFFVRTDVEDYKVRPWFVFNSNNRSYANGGDVFYDFGRFLRVLDQKGAEGAAAQKPSYDEALKVVLGTGLRSEKDVAALLAKANEFYQARIRVNAEQ
ncbi:MAG: hypothetical protein V1740_06715 [Candidatus Woesearchaeota archaeon]